MEAPLEDLMKWVKESFKVNCSRVCETKKIGKISIVSSQKCSDADSDKGRFKRKPKSIVKAMCSESSDRTESDKQQKQNRQHLPMSILNEQKDGSQYVNGNAKVPRRGTKGSIQSIEDSKEPKMLQELALEMLFGKSCYSMWIRIVSMDFPLLDC